MSKYLSVFTKKFPQNFIIKKPAKGGLILFFFAFLFTLLYHPLNAHKSLYFSFEFTMLLYTGISSLAVLAAITLLKYIPYFSKAGEWTFLKEIIALYIILQAAGIAVFLAGFFIESPGDSRWNLPTFTDSCINTFLIYIFPFAFCTAVNYKYLLYNFKPEFDAFRNEHRPEIQLKIKSSLKNESLSFIDQELLYAVSDGNYVIFHLYKENKLRKVSLRNTISQVEIQLKDIPHFFRCHRAYIVNTEQIESFRGNSSGYQLKIQHSNNRVPVSRKKTKTFRTLMANKPK
jgi:hypothetical protein